MRHPRGRPSLPARRTRSGSAPAHGGFRPRALRIGSTTARRGTLASARGCDRKRRLARRRHRRLRRISNHRGSSSAGRWQHAAFAYATSTQPARGCLRGIFCAARARSTGFGTVCASSSRGVAAFAPEIPAATATTCRRLLPGRRPRTGRAHARVACVEHLRRVVRAAGEPRYGRVFRERRRRWPGAHRGGLLVNDIFCQNRCSPTSARAKVPRSSSSRYDASVVVTADESIARGRKRTRRANGIRVGARHGADS